METGFVLSVLVPGKIPIDGFLVVLGQPGPKAICKEVFIRWGKCGVQVTMPSGMILVAIESFLDVVMPAALLWLHFSECFESREGVSL